MSAQRPLMVTMADARAASVAGQGVLCAPGIRGWFRRYGLDLRRFLREGLPADEVTRTGDAFALRAVEHARRRAHG